MRLASAHANQPRQATLIVLCIVRPCLDQCERQYKFWHSSRHYLVPTCRAATAFPTSPLLSSRFCTSIFSFSFCLSHAISRLICYDRNSCSSDVRTFYSSYDTTCASVSASGSTTAAASTTPVASSAAATTTASATCENTAASSLGCDAYVCYVYHCGQPTLAIRTGGLITFSKSRSDLSSCFCLSDFATAVKKCLYETYVPGTLVPVCLN